MSKAVEDWITKKQLEKDLSEKKVITLEQHEEEVQHLTDKFTIITSALLTIMLIIFLIVWFTV